jgi:hypothetical protein
MTSPARIDLDACEAGDLPRGTPAVWLAFVVAARALLAVEWGEIDYQGNACCPACHGFKAMPPHALDVAPGHDADCPLTAALAPFRGRA